ncbi:MAG: penicillin-binding transpeptidase domain-containing protein [Bacteroidota bacterium]
MLNNDDLFLAKQEPLPGKLCSLPNYAYHLLYRNKSEGRSRQTINSTLNAQLQIQVGATVNKYSRLMTNNQIHNAAAIVIEIETGETKAYIGNSTNPGQHGQHVDIITSLRSPGSLLKPFLYAAALDEGLIMPTQLLPDIPAFYRGFSPKNFDKKYRGAIPADQALVSSLNVPFVNLLMEYGYEKFHKKLVEMGFKSFSKPASYYGLSLILGGAETSLWELANVYSGMARASANFMGRPINKGYSINDYRSNTYLVKTKTSLLENLNSDGFLRVPSIDYTLKVLQEVKRPEEEAGWEFYTSSRSISWKTGTSFGFRDGWAIGLDGRYLIGVWVGNADGEGRPGLTGIQAAAPLLFQLFELVEANPVEREIYGETVQICKESGMLASKICPNPLSVKLPHYLLDNKNCNNHQLIHLNEEGKYQVNSSCYQVSSFQSKPWFVLPPVQSWYYKKYHANYQELPPYFKSCDTNESKRLIGLIYPAKYTKVYIPTEQDGKKGKVIFEAAHEHRESIIHWHLDQKFLGSTQGTHQMGINTSKGMHSITLIDEMGNEVRQWFEVVN